jgi:phosphoglycolate phosphatase
MDNKQLNLIFDFDGTLVDSFNAAMSNLAILANERCFRMVDREEIETLKNLTSKELIKYLKIPFYKLPRILRDARECMRNEMSALTTFMELPEVLSQLQDMNCSMGIVTSNSVANVEAWLEHQEISHFFDFIHGESSYFGKKRILKKIMKSYAMHLPDTFYIGDETRDVEAAKKCNIHSIAVTWGFNSEEVLSRCEPSYIARSPRDLLAILGEGRQ